jgi:hypothetical protein
VVSGINSLAFSLSEIHPGDASGITGTINAAGYESLYYKEITILIFERLIFIGQIK